MDRSENLTFIECEKDQMDCVRKWNNIQSVKIFITILFISVFWTQECDELNLAAVDEEHKWEVIHTVKGIWKKFT